MFQDTVEGYKRIINLGARLNVTKEQLRVKSIAQTAEAFEDFVLDYAQHHLSDSMPEIHRVYKKLGMFSLHLFLQSWSNLGSKA